MRIENAALSCNVNDNHYYWKTRGNIYFCRRHFKQRGFQFNRWKFVVFILQYAKLPGAKRDSPKLEQHSNFL